MAGPSNISQASLLDLKAITAEHVDRFSKEGRSAQRSVKRAKLESKDPFDRPSPGLIKRLAAEAKNDAKRRHFQDEAGPSDEQRRRILEAKAKKYEQLRRGDHSGMTERELAEAVIDFDRKAEEEWSDHSSDVDESAPPARRLEASYNENQEEVYDDLARVEYVDEMGRTRIGTRREAREAEKARQEESRTPAPIIPADKSSYAEVIQSNVIHGDQKIFPVYEPDPDAIREKYRQAEEEARAHHYDSTKEVRTRGAGAYQFSLDEDARKEQMASLDAQRVETENARAKAGNRGGLTAAQEMRKRKLDERKALVEAKRTKMLGGAEEVERLRREKATENHISRMRVDRCDFSGFKVYPSNGKTYVRGDSKVFRFLNSKNESLFLQRKNPRKIAWTQVYRRMHKKGITEEVAKRRSRKNVKTQRGVVGADISTILARRTAKPEVRAAARQAAISKAKTEKREKESKKATKPAGGAPTAPKVSKQAMKGAGGKGGR
ncbi:hypothetical protein TREMEDRAFT_73338 [Tremella mesenterica DSM 1558]|uniref:uncharacterized protein n=1 Tax=Tremella mesenterica (strain ATCC 24925 / CBS 8224 / DSM 1558 / NBRC 9311 / NRRL Y-6157 / RJB 2259-6 / UBC 559-6) TaxID=578456 RepID=UPI0003F4A145|nr:uncharacterized protein TREMEDRAFT_73338 [Tremella mesenterica DSM 1558]EIW71548.1 hypothetical protein TREMEDRAFT_73338 [Tremella mesenterica DSM 1558]